MRMTKCNTLSLYMRPRDLYGSFAEVMFQNGWRVIELARRSSEHLLLTFVQDPPEGFEKMHHSYRLENGRKIVIFFPSLLKGPARG